METLSELRQIRFEVEKLIDEQHYFEAIDIAERELSQCQNQKHISELDAEIHEIMLLRAHLYLRINSPETALEKFKPTCDEVLAKLGIVIYQQTDFKIQHEAKNLDETLGIMASIYKEIWKINYDKKSAELSLKIYKLAFELGASTWTGINTAVMAGILGYKDISQNYANKTLKLCNEQIISKIDPNIYWTFTTLAEASLLLGQASSAFKYYKKALEHMNSKLLTKTGTSDQKNTSYKQLLFIKEYYKDIQIPQKILLLLKPKPYTIFFGHMIDKYDRAQLRFPHNKKLLELVKKKLSMN